MKLTIKYLTKKQFIFNCDSTKTISEIKNDIIYAENLKNQIRLFSNKIELDDTKYLHDFVITDLLLIPKNLDFNLCDL